MRVLLLAYNHILTPVTSACYPSGVSCIILPSTLGSSLQAAASNWSTEGTPLVLLGRRPLVPRSLAGECERQGETPLFGGRKPSLSSCFTTEVFLERVTKDWWWIEAFRPALPCFILIAWKWFWTADVRFGAISSSTITSAFARLSYPSLPLPRYALVTNLYRCSM